MQKGPKSDKLCIWRTVVKWAIDEISVIYGDLYNLHEFLKNAYEIQVVSWMISGLLNNVTYWFATYTLIDTSTVNWLAFSTYCVITTGLFFDGYLICAVCEKNCALWREARELFKKFYLLESIDCRLDQSVSWFKCPWVIIYVFTSR